MTESQWGEFWKALDDLWPGKLNEAQAAIWKSRVLGLPQLEAMGALNDYYTYEKKPRDGPIPSLVGYLRRVRTHGEDRHMKKGGGTPPQEWHGIIREVWKAQEPDRIAEFEAMSKNDIMLRQYQGEYEESCRVYGKHARGTATSYWRWQAQAYRMGLRDNYPGRPEVPDEKWGPKVAWSWGAQVLYLEEVHEYEEAKRVKAEYKRVVALAPGVHHNQRALAPPPPVTQP